MSLMDISNQDDCIIETMEPAKKKKLKQARLPFQMLTSLETQNGVSNKKRKLTSPLVEYKSPKVLKITAKENSAADKEKKLNSDSTSTSDTADECVVLTEEEHENGVDEIVTSDAAVTPNSKSAQKKPPLSRGKRTHKLSMTPTSLIKFFKQGKEAEDSNNDTKSSVEKEEDAEKKEKEKEETDSISEEKYIPEEVKKETDLDERNGLQDEINDCICATPNSDIEICSSDNEDKEEEKEVDISAKHEAKVESPRIAKTPKLDKSIEKKHKKLTPKQQDKKLETARKREERERLRMEKEKKLEEERESKRKEKEEKRKEKEEKLKEKKLKEQKRQMELEQKQKEREAKEEERRKREEAKEEERRKKEEEKLEAQRKKEKAASNFASFFVAKKQEAKSTEDEKDLEVKNFMPFEVKADMKVAPILRRSLTDQEKSVLDNECESLSMHRLDLYLSQLRNKEIIPRSSSKTWPLEAKDDVVVLDDDNDDQCTIVDQPTVVQKHRPKLLQFCENRRPPYWGTWRKRSWSVTARRPFARDVEWFDYDVDSDEEWEEEEPGESLHGSDDEKDEENPEDNEYDVDNEFMVPHGYLSDEEAQADEEEKEDMSPETQKFKLKLLGEQFECEMKEKTSKLKPKMIGCIWQGPNNEIPENVPPKVANFLLARQAWVFQVPVVLSSKSENETSISGDNATPTKPQAPSTSKKTKVPREAVPDLIRLVHGNTHGKVFLVKEFMAYWTKKHKVGERQLSKVSLAHKIREIGKWVACPEEGPMHLKACWYVPEDVRKEYLPASEEIVLPNRWSYTLTPKRKSDLLDQPDKVEKDDKEKDREKKSVPLITQFTKKITQEEMKKQLTTMSPNNLSGLKPPEQRSPKRATLISVPRGQQFSQTSRENLLKKFVTTEKLDDGIAQTKRSGKLTDVAVVVLTKLDMTQKIANVNEGTGNNNRPQTIQSADARVKGNSEKTITLKESSEKHRNEVNTTNKISACTEQVEAKVETPMDVDEP